MTRPPATRPAVDDAEPVEPAERAGEQDGGGATRTSTAGTTPARSWRSRLPYAVELLALLPAIWTARRVAAGTLMPYQDYWDALYRIVTPDGSPHLRGFFTYQNEHPFAVPGVLFYLGAKFGDGSNHTLGYYDVLVGIATVVLLRFLLPKVWSPMGRAWMTVAMSVVVFTPAGLWNFVRGMSGAAWLTANLLAIVAIALATRRRTVLALAAACLAVLSYGTGFGAFLAIAVVAFVLRQGRWRVLVPLGLLAVTGAIWVVTSHGGSSGTGVSHDPALLASTFLSNIGMLWAPTNTETGVLVGVAGLVLLVAAGTVAWRRTQATASTPSTPSTPSTASTASTVDTVDTGPEPAAGGAPVDLAPWWGLAAYATAASALISLGRSEIFDGAGVQSRYASLPGLFWIAVAVLCLRLLVASWSVVVRGAAVAAGAVVFLAQSTPLANQAVAEQPAQDMLANAVRIGHAQAFQDRFHFPQDNIQRLKALGDYPFDGQYSLGCGGLVPGDRVPLSGASALSPASAHVDSDQLTVDSRYVRGWLRSTKPVRCVLVTDPSGRIVGGGTYGFQRTDVAAALRSTDTKLGWEAVAPSNAGDIRLVVGFDDGYRIVPSPPTR